VVSDKPWDKLSSVEQRVNRVYCASMTDRVQITLERFTGFEIFNTRPYHNYESWAAGWRASDAWGNRASAEDLDDCLNKLCDQREAQLDALTDEERWKERWER
jgi:hypothetical protein